MENQRPVLQVPFPARIWLYFYEKKGEIIQFFRKSVIFIFLKKNMLKEKHAQTTTQFSQQFSTVALQK